MLNVVFDGKLAQMIEGFRREFEWRIAQVYQYNDNNHDFIPFSSICSKISKVVEKQHCFCLELNDESFSCADLQSLDKNWDNCPMSMDFAKIHDLVINL